MSTKGEIYGTRSDYKRRYRQQHPDDVRAQRGFRPKMSPTDETGACKSHKP